MDSIYYYDFASLLFLLIILVFSRFIFNKHKKINIAFNVILGSVFLFTVISMIINFLLAQDTFNVDLVFILKSINAVAFGCISAGFLYYAYADISQTTKLNKAHLIGIVLSFTWNIIWLIVNDYTRVCFDVNRTGVLYGPGYIALFFSLIFVMIYFPALELYYHKDLYGTSVKIAFTYAFLSLGYGILCLVYKLFTGNVFFLTSLFFSIQLMVAFIQMVIDRLNIDNASNLYQNKQCLKDINHSNGSSLFFIEILGYYQYKSSIIDKLVIDLKHYFRDNITNFTLYRVSNYQLLLKTRRNDDIGIINIINEYSKNAIKIEDNVLAIRIKTAIMKKEPIDDASDTLNLLELMINKIKEKADLSIVLTNSLRSELENQSTNVNRIMNAIDNGGAIPFYQGIFSVIDNKITLCEALARIRINDELLMPSSFISVLENNHCTSKLDRSILIGVLKELKKQKEENDNFDIRAISINLTAEDIVNKEFIDDVKRLIIENKIDPSMICFEICETTVISNFEMVKEVMNDLNSLGIRFFLDDFGVGFSNVQAVLKLPFYLIKIDKSILDATKENSQNIEVLNGFVRTLNSVGVKTLVEGVEDEHDLNVVKTAGAHYIQGYYFHKPSEMDKLKTLVN